MIKDQLIIINNKNNNRLMQEANNNQTLTFFRQFISNPDLLAKGHTIIKDFLLQSPNNRSDTLQNLLHDQIPVLTLVNYIYSLEVYSQVNQQQKSATRAFIVKLLHQNLTGMSQNFNIQNSLMNLQNKKNYTYYCKKAQALLSFINKLHNVDGYERWSALYKQLLTSPETQSINPEIHAFWLLRILRPSDDRIYVFTYHVFNFVSAGKIHFTRQQTLQIFYHCVKSFGHLVGTDDQLLNKCINPQMQGLITYVIQSSKFSLRSMRQSLRILVLLYSDFQLQTSVRIIEFMRQIGLILAKEHLRINISAINDKISDQDYEYQALEQDNQIDQQSQPSLQLLYYQYLSLVEAIQESGESLFKKFGKIFPPSLLFWLITTAVLPDYRAMKFWSRQQDQYLVDLDDQGVRTLRNKAIQMLLNLIQNSNQMKKKCLQYLNKYLHTIIQHIYSDQQQFRKALQIHFEQNGLGSLSLCQLMLPHYFYEQSSYFILYSFTNQILVSSSNKQTLFQSLMNRLQSTSQNLLKYPILKIMGLTLINKLAKQIVCNVQKQAAYLQYLFKIAAKQIDNVGMMITICRGIGSLAYRRVIIVVPQYSITISNGINIPVALVEHFVQYVTNPKCLISVDSSHMILETLIKLVDGKTKQSQQNQTMIEPIFTKQKWWVIIKTYMHDGMASSLIGKLLFSLANDQLIQEVWENVKFNTPFVNSFQAFYQLIANAIKSQKLTISEDQLQTIIKNYSRNLTVVAKIIKQYLILGTTETVISKASIQLLNETIHQSWVLPLLKKNMLWEPEKMLIKVVSKITNQITSQYQLQNHLVLPYYCFSNNCKAAIQLLSSHSIYDRFIEKLFSYAALFRGQAIRAVTSCVFLHICQFDKRWVEKTINLVESYGKIKNDQWQDQDDSQEEICQEIIQCRIVNQQAQECMESAFPNFAFNTQGIAIQLQKIKMNRF